MSQIREAEVPCDTSRRAPQPFGRETAAEVYYAGVVLVGVVTFLRAWF
jgi:hypothetical protein